MVPAFAVVSNCDAVVDNSFEKTTSNDTSTRSALSGYPQKKRASMVIGETTPATTVNKEKS